MTSVKLFKTLFNGEIGKLECLLPPFSFIRKLVLQTHCAVLCFKSVGRFFKHRDGESLSLKVIQVPTRFG